MSDLISAAGSLGTVVLGLGALAVLVAGALGFMSMRQRRIPLVAFVAFPALAVIVGALGAWSSAGGALEALDIANPDSIPAAATAGLWNALALDTLSRWTAAFAFGVGAWCASLGALSGGDDTQKTTAAGALAVLVTLGGAGLVAGFGAAQGVGGDAAILAGVIVFAGLGVALGSFKRALDEQAQRVAGMRFVSVMCMMLAVSYGSKAVVMSSRMAALGPNGIAVQADDLTQAIGIWLETGAPVQLVGWLALAVGLGIAFFGVFGELGEVFYRYTLLDVFATTALMSMVGVTRLVESGNTNSLLSIATNDPASELFKDMGSDLQAALVTIDGEPTALSHIEGGFGDVFIYKNEKITRTHKWNGAGWDSDNTDLESATLSPMRPLVFFGSGDEAAFVVSVLEKTQDGKLLLAMRANEVKGDVEVPVELAHMQLSYIEVVLTSERNLETDLWLDGGESKYRWGPVYWYGESEAEEPVELAQEVADDTEASALHITLGERARVKDIAGSCLNWMTVLDGEDVGISDERTCDVTTDDAETIRGEAVELWEIPEPEFTRLTAKKVEGDQLAEEDVIDRIIREAGAIDFCIQTAREEGEEDLDGVMTLNLWVNKKGRISTITPGERSRNESPVVSRCAALRLKNVTVPWPEDYEEPEVEDGEEPPPMPKYELTLDVRQPR